MRRALLIAVAFACTGAGSKDTLTDEALVTYAATDFDKAKMMFHHELLGLHHGAKVMADFPCGDICPDATSRIIRYALEPGMDCASVGGVEQPYLIPHGPGMFAEKFCVPAVLARKSP
jgi:hypothetical protein